MDNARLLEPPSADNDDFECQVVPEAVFLEVLASASRALEGRVTYATIGGVGCAVWGRPRWTYDIDFFVRPDDAGRALSLLNRAGFATRRVDPQWIHKAFARGVLVDVIFRTVGDICLDDEMVARTACRSFRGVDVRVLAPEDLVVIKALVAKERRPHHWHDALGIMAKTPLDWSYLVQRAEVGVHRVASLLLYAQSVDLPVPDDAVRALLEAASIG